MRNAQKINKSKGAKAQIAPQGELNIDGTETDDSLENWENEGGSYV